LKIEKKYILNKNYIIYLFVMIYTKGEIIIDMLSEDNNFIYIVFVMLLDLFQIYFLNRI